MCQQIWDLFWQLRQATIIPVRCRAMVSSSALEETTMGRAACQQIWYLFWQLRQATSILVRCGAMVSSSALEETALGSAGCQQIWDLAVLAVAAGPDHTCVSRTDDAPSRFPEPRQCKHSVV